MSEAINQMLEAKSQALGILRASVLPLFLVLAVSLTLELWLSKSWPSLTFGLLVGGVFSLGNIAFLFSLMSPYFFFGEKPILFAAALIISLSIAVALTLCMSFFGALFGVGFGLGVAAPAFLGGLYAIGSCATRSKSEMKTQFPLDLR